MKHIKDPRRYVYVGMGEMGLARRCTRSARLQMKRVEKDPEGGWIARGRDGSIIIDEHWRWSSRSAARAAVDETDLLEAQVDVIAAQAKQP